MDVPSKENLNGDSKFAVFPYPRKESVGYPFCDFADILEKPVLLTTTIRRKRPIDSGGN
jgi:hypothetical protein